MILRKRSTVASIIADFTAKLEQLDQVRAARLVELDELKGERDELEAKAEEAKREVILAARVSAQIRALVS